MQESPALKPDYFEILSHIENFRYTTTFQGLIRILEEGKLVYSSLLTVIFL